RLPARDRRLPRPYTTMSDTSVAATEDRRCRRSSPCSAQQFPQHIRQYPAMPVIIDFDRRIDPENCVDLFGLAVFPFDTESTLLTRPNHVAQANDTEHFRSIQFQ